MFFIRNVEESDIDDLYELSKQANFINLPEDKALITKKVRASIRSFASNTLKLENSYYIFVLVDSSLGKVIGTSMIHAQHGTELEPHFFLKVSYEHKFSETINTGFTHGMLKLGLDTDGPTEIGGLILHPDYRSNELKLGKQLSFVRFLYMALNKSRFKEEIHSELMPPFDKNGNAPLWEAIGRRFMNMNYKEADILSRSNKEFILSLYPEENIYVTLLPMDAKNAIGKVGADTIPVQRMLESIGFEYINEIDPFDGGPHYRAKLEEITPIKNSRSIKIRSVDILEKKSSFMIQLNQSYSFSAIQIFGKIKGDVLEVHCDDYLHLEKLLEKQKVFNIIPL